ncbi:MAG: hypothetical protein KDD58_04315 [Bdellovibrionales bacterium]|nr:hypothetical protein [Bdellovibrionales bacterium]
MRSYKSFISIILILLFTQINFAQENESTETTESNTSIDTQSLKNEEAKDNQSNEKKVNFAKKEKPPIDTNKGLEVVYGSSPWNTDSTKIDNAELFVKDANSGRIMKILLEETEPDSSTFSGNFSVGYTGGQELNPEVYIPPEKIRGKNAQLNSFVTKIRDGKVARKPIVFKKGKDGQQLLDVFDTREQAQQSMEAYKEKIKQEEAQKSLAKPVEKVVKKADQEAAALAARQAKLAELAAQAASREEERVRLEQLERQKALERIKKQQELAEREKIKRKEQAKKLAEEAMQAYQQGDFLKAEELFKKSIELDPSDTSYYFSYGVSLYRNEKYNEALVTLKIAEVDETTEIEKYYYMGLIHFRLAELDQAVNYFRKVKNSNHEIMSPSAAFYEGVILYTSEKYKDAQPAFEFVLDNSKDPRLDEKAEEYIEKIARALVFKKKQDRRHDFAVSVGTTYDSNVLYSPDNQADQGSATDSAGLRLSETLSYQYRAIYQREFEWSFDLSQLYLYSLDSDLQIADPMIVSLKSPVIWKGVWGKKGFKLAFQPGYELLYLDTDPDDATNPPSSNILKSILFDIDFTLVMRDNWFSNYVIESRQDDSLDDTSTGDDDADATLLSLKTTQTFLMDKSKKKVLQAGGGYTLNAAKGKNKKYNKILLNFRYLQPFKKWKDASWYGTISLYHLDYNKASTDRTDRNYALGYGISKAQNKWFNWGANLTYTTNNSTNSTNQYTKYTALLTASFDIDEWVYGEKE